MKIDLTNIPPGGKRANFRLTPDWWKPGPDEDRLAGCRCVRQPALSLAGYRNRYREASLANSTKVASYL